MKSVMALTAVNIEHATSPRVRVDDETRSWWLGRENACLTQNNARLRARLEDLEASAHSWIRLYEAALERAHAATAECIRLRQQLPQA